MASPFGALPHIEGCITYDLTVLASPLRPVEVNLQRFFFPECKAYELDHRGADPQHRKRFWNAVGSFGSYYPPRYDTILRENVDALAGRDCRTLLPTTASGVYANRFRGDGKEIYTLFNGTGHTFYGAVLPSPLVALPKAGEGSTERAGDRCSWHVFDLLNGRDVDWDEAASPRGIRLFLSRDDVGCLAVLPRRASVRVTASGADLRVSGEAADRRMVLCDPDGHELASSAVSEGRATLPLSPSLKRPNYIKVLRQNLLEDAVGLD